MGEVADMTSHKARGNAWWFFAPQVRTTEECAPSVHDTPACMHMWFTSMAAMRSTRMQPKACGRETAHTSSLTSRGTCFSRTCGRRPRLCGLRHNALGRTAALQRVWHVR